LKNIVLCGDNKLTSNRLFWPHELFLFEAWAGLQLQCVTHTPVAFGCFDVNFNEVGYMKMMFLST